MIHDDFLWTEKYRPKTVEDTILPENIKSVFRSFVEQKNVPTLLLTGSSGVGKTTIAKAMVDELESDWVMINGSLEGRLIDTLRTSVVDFASTVSFSGGRKYIIIDEADYLNPTSVQPALRNFIEEYSNNCGFILTCNYKNKLISAIHSRCTIVDFKINKAESGEMAKQFFQRCCGMLKQESIEVNKTVLAEVIKKFYPDWRRVINELQKYSSVSHKIDTGILDDLKEVNLAEVVGLIKNKDFKTLRKWVSDNSDVDSTSLFQSFFDHANTYFKKTSVPILILLLAKYQYQVSFVASHEINTMAFLVEVMTECEVI